MFENGDSVAQEEAVRWYRLAAAQRYAGAQCNLGLMLYRSFAVVAQDKAKALRWWLLAAGAGARTRSDQVEATWRWKRTSHRSFLLVI